MRVVDAVRPSVVTVTAYSSKAEDTPTQGWSSDLKKSVGSGVVLNSAGHILTTTSVVGASRNLFVRTAGGDERPAIFLGADHTNDLVLLQVKPEGLFPAPIGHPAQLTPGAWAIIVGESAGDFPHYAFGSFTTVATANAEPCLLQMSTQLYPGNTGGAVANADGEVVGVVLGAISALPAPAAGGAVNESAAPPQRPLPASMSVAIPIDRAQQVAADLAAHGTTSAGFLGVRVRTPAAALKDLLKFEDGVLIMDVLAASPAAAAGIEAGDVILSFAGKPVREQAELVRLVSAARPGARCTVELLRGDLRLVREVTVGAAPPGPDTAGRAEDIEREAIRKRMEELRQELERLEERLGPEPGS
jgi:serine protease Do